MRRTPLPEALACVLKELLAEQHLYSDPKSRLLTETAAAYYGMSPGEVFADSGSDMILSLT